MVIQERLVVWMAWLAACVVVGCAPSPGDTCMPGRSIACTCVDGRMGAQVCRDNNTYDPCVCGGTDAGVADARDGSSRDVTTGGTTTGGTTTSGTTGGTTTSGTTTSGTTTGGTTTGSTTTGGTTTSGTTGGTTTGGTTTGGTTTGTAVGTLDLLLAVDNSNSMRENQEFVLARLSDLVNALTNPPCRSRTDPNVAPHPCVASNPDDVPVASGVADLRVGVISTDLGTPGTTVPGCTGRELGDDGLLNPLGRPLASDGITPLAIQRHLPWNSMAPSTFRPTECRALYEGANPPPDFLSFVSGSGASLTQFVSDWQCMAGLYVGGCGLEQQLEAVYRALVVHGADRPAGTLNAPNAGFLRADATLAIVVLSDEEDGSIRYCNDGLCDDARDVYVSAATRWSHANLNMRFYNYVPGDTRDPTWNPTRYVDPNPAAYPADPLNNPTAIPGLLRLKPGRPDRIVFAAITGVPPGAATLMGDQYVVNWDTLLGPPGPNGPDDFYGRQGQQAFDNPTYPNGYISMRQPNLDSRCADVFPRAVPACRRVGQPEPPYNPNDPASVDNYCSQSGQYFAQPSRRIVEVARRFDQARLCNGAACGNGVVTSICEADYRPAIDAIVSRIRRRLGN